MTERLRRIILSPVAPEPLEMMLALYAIVRGAGILAFDGLTAPTYRYALGLAPEWVWGALPLALGVFQLAALLHDRYRRAAALVQASWWVAWVALVVLGNPAPTLIPFVAPWLISVVGCGWVWLLRSWDRRYRASIE